LFVNQIEMMLLFALFAVSASAGGTYKIDNSCASPTRNDCSATIEKVLGQCAHSTRGTCTLSFAEGDYPLHQGLSYQGIQQLEFVGDGVEIILEAESMGKKTARNLRAGTLEHITADCSLPTRNDCAKVIADAVADCKKHAHSDCQLEFDEGDYPLHGDGFESSGLNSVTLSGDGAALTIKAVAMGVKYEAHKNLKSNLGTDRIFHVERPTGKAEKKILGALLDDFAPFVDVFGHTADGVDVRVNAEKLDLFAKAGMKHEDRTDQWFEHFSTNLGNASFVCQDSAEVCAASDGFYDSYQRLAAITTRITSVAAANPTIATISSLGKSYEGRDQTAITIKKGSAEKPTVFYFCGEHAREWLPVMYCTWMAEQLVENGGHGLLDQVQFVILPVMNPDGYEYSHTTNNMWRKSRQPNPGSSCIGTDLNRNYGQAHCGQGSSTNQCSDTYCGTAAFDNLETNNLKAFAEATKARGGSVLVQTDVHAYGQMWMNPYGSQKALPEFYSDMKAAGDATADAIRGVSGYSFVTGTIADVIYVASGSSCDWFYTEHGVTYAYAPEVRGRSFQPSATEIKPSNDELFAGMIAQVEYAVKHPPTAAAVTTNATATPCQCSCWPVKMCSCC
jgi:hypothetical protein